MCKESEIDVMLKAAEKKGWNLSLDAARKEIRKHILPKIFGEEVLYLKVTDVSLALDRVEKH